MNDFTQRLSENRPLVYAALGVIALSAIFSCFSCNSRDIDKLRAELHGSRQKAAAAAGRQDDITRQAKDKDQSTPSDEFTSPLERVAQKLARQPLPDDSLADSEVKAEGAAPVPDEGAGEFRCPEGAVPVGAPPPKGNLFWCSAKSALGSGAKLGPYIKWDQDGNKRFQAYYINDQPQGVMTTYYTDERKEEEKEYRNGVLNGRWTQWNRDGDKVAEGTFAAGKKNGKFRYWDRHGDLSSEGSYRNNLESGVWINYYPDGETQSKIAWQNGMKNGRAETYYQNGQLSAVGNYKDNKYDGLWMYYTEEGRLKTRGSYLEGRKNGPWTNYDQNGRPLNTRNYDNGHALRGDNRRGRPAVQAQQRSNTNRWVEM
jgi:antitoxin component YwqK of YwqJK toxin-antitoxin module